jgi:pantoate--beta-alanine ligase
MNTMRTIPALRAALAEPRRAGASIGLVPTMGAFHEGHLSLMRRARADCDVMVVSLFVNPAQFDDPGDLEAYPRDAERDERLAEQAGADYLFAPEPHAMYPAGFATTVSVSGLTGVLEGAQRGRGHFDGVATVVTKLFNIVEPDVAYFGQKDAQQALVIKRLVADLDIPVQVQICPTVREPDGLAMSSRNRLLSEPERRRALSLRRALTAARESVARGERDPQAARAVALNELDRAGVRTEYLELVAPETLQPVASLEGETLAVVAASVGAIRLIDNETINAGRP